MCTFFSNPAHETRLLAIILDPIIFGSGFKPTELDPMIFVWVLAVLDLWTQTQKDINVKKISILYYDLNQNTDPNPMTLLDQRMGPKIEN